MNKQKKNKSNTTADSSQFYINVRYHQNNSWQGSIQRLDTGETINFRSTLEMLAQMEAVIAQQSSDQQEDQRLRSWKNQRR